MEIEGNRSKEGEPVKTCKICDGLDGKYTCPRCNILYCSLACYKGQAHAHCSEQFYQECVQSELASLDCDSEAKKKMEEILKSVRSQFEEDENEDIGGEGDIDSDDAEEDEDDLEARLAGIDLEDSEAVWEKLNESERKEFSKLIASGKITETLPAWDPWWVTGEALPPLAPDIPYIATLTSSPPSPMLPFLVMNTLISYQVTLRMLRGQSSVLSVEAATAIWALSAPLQGALSSPCSSLGDALKLVLLECEKCPWMRETPVDCEQMAEDLRSLTTCDYCYILLALSDIKTIFDEAAKIAPATRDSQRFTGYPPKAHDLKKVSKKIVFYLAWAKQYDDVEWDRLVGVTSNIIEL